MAAPAHESGATAPASEAPVLAAVKDHRAALQARNDALAARREVCVKRVRDGVIKPTAMAQFSCLMGGEPK